MNSKKPIHPQPNIVKDCGLLGNEVKMAYKRKLVVYKTSWLDNLKETPSKEIERFLKTNGTIMQDLQKEKEEIELTLNLAKQMFSDAKIIYRGDLPKENINDYDIVIAVGGDGTLLEVSHYIKDKTPVFLINSDYRSDGGSEGFFSGATRHDLAEKVNRLLAGELKTTEISRLEAELDGKKLNELILNDLLVAHSVPAGMTRYNIRINNQEWVEHKNSGLYIAAGGGSTGAVRSCGGKILPVTSKKFQFAAMAPYQGRLTKLKMTKKVLQKDDIVEIESRMTNGMLFIDGRFVSYKFPIGSTLKVYNSDKPLHLIGFNFVAKKSLS